MMITGILAFQLEHILVMLQDILVDVVSEEVLIFLSLRGNFRYSLGWFGTDKYYNQNELGYYNQQNSQRLYGRVRYQILTEFKSLRTYSNYLFFGETKRYDTFKKV